MKDDGMEEQFKILQEPSIKEVLLKMYGTESALTRMFGHPLKF